MLQKLFGKKHTLSKKISDLTSKTMSSNII
jgi:hypothetical protein